MWIGIKKYGQLPALFLLARLVLFLTLPLEGVVGYGDYWNFYNQAALGWPYLDYWSEFPPLFPILSRFVFLVAGGREHTYQYLLALTLSAVQALNIGLFIRLAETFRDEISILRRAGGYALVLLGLGYGWWFFDPLAVCMMLLGLLWTLDNRDSLAGLALGLGALVKWFPFLVLAVVWRFLPPRRALRITLFSVGIVVLVLGSLWVVSPEMTSASLRAQGAKGSWETVWALLDGNLSTGNFPPEVVRTDPRTLDFLSEKEARIDPLLTLLVFGGLGFWLFGRVGGKDHRTAAAFLGVTWVVFLFWSPGFSPQWVLYLLPLVFLVLPERQAVLMAVVLILINLLEWPVLLSRGYFSSLWMLIPVRTLILALLGISFFPFIRKPARNDLASSNSPGVS